MTAKQFGARLRAARRAQGYTIEQMAEKVGISGNFLGEVERGNKLPSMSTFLRMVNVLDVSADCLLKDDQHKPYRSLDMSLYKRFSELTPAQREAFTTILEDLLAQLQQSG